MPNQYDLTVQSNEPLTKHMRQVILEGSSLEEFPEDQESGYVKVAFTQDNGDRVLRSYTVRAFDRKTLTLDFVDHGDTGPASKWVRHAESGQLLTVYGPGEKKLVDPEADWFLIGGDLASLPAISVNLETLSDGAKGYAVIEIPDEEDQQPLSHPQGVELIWIMAGKKDLPNKLLSETIRSLKWLEGTPYPWFAGEFEGMREMRKYLRDERGIDRRAMYLSCYWKYGETDEGMKQAKQRDAQDDALRNPAEN